MTSPANQFYTRQQVAKLADVTDDVLAYWLKQGLLIPTSGGEGRGDHRRFDYVQVNIAAIFGQLRNVGLNITALRSLADVLQRAANLGKTYNLHPSNYSQAAHLGSTLCRFRAGHEVLISKRALGEKKPEGLSGSAYGDWLLAKRPAASEDEIIGEKLGERDDYDKLEDIIAAANGMGSGREIEAQAYADLVYQIVAPGYTDTYSWLLSIRPELPCNIEFGQAASFFETLGSGSPEDFGPGIFLPVSGVIRRTWGLKTFEQHRIERDEIAIRNLLSKAGISDGVQIIWGEEGGFYIDAPNDLPGSIAAALKGTRFEVSEDGA